MFATTLTIPTRQLHEFTRRMSQAGYTVVDTGTRVTTDDGPESEATVRLLHTRTARTGPIGSTEDQDARLRVEVLDPVHIELGVSA